MLNHFRSLLYGILLALLFQKGLAFYKTGEFFITNLDIPFVAIPVFLLFVIGWTDGKPLNTVTDDSEYEEVTWSEYWDRYENEESTLSDIFAWVLVILPLIVFMYGFYQNETAYLWSKYAIIFLEIVSIVFLMAVPTHGVIKLITGQKLLNIASIVSSLIVLIFAIYAGDWVLAIVMFVGLITFLNKVFA